MEIATLRETANFTNKTNAVSPYCLGQVLQMYPSQAWVLQKISESEIDPGQIPILEQYAKLTDLPTKLSQLTNDANYVQTVGGLIPSALLPSFVDDVIEFDSIEDFPTVGESGKIYITKDTNITYRWSGTDYVEISKSLALGETSLTAYRGDRGKTAYDHSQTTGNPHDTSLSDLGVTVSAATLNYLTGLNKNIMTALGEKLDISGGTMTGYLFLNADPTQRMHAATKSYVDACIDGISVTVTQNVTKISNLEEDMDSVNSTLAIQATTNTQVQNALTGLNQTTSDHTQYISELHQDVAGLTSTVTEDHHTVTVLEATVNLLQVDLERDNVIVQIDENNKPLTSATYEISYDCKFQGGATPPDLVQISGSHTGITVTHNNGKLYVQVSSDTAIPDATNIYTIVFKYTRTVLYTCSKALIIATIPKGAQGEQGIQGEKGPQGAQGPQGPAGSDGTVKSTTAPTDTNKLWLDLNDGKLKQYQMNAGGTTGSWVVVNDYSDTTSELNARLAELTDSLNSQLDALNTIVAELREHTDTSFEQTSDSFNLKFTQMQETITQTIDGLQTHIQEQEEYIRFRNGTITLGVVGNLYTLYLDNDEIVINYNGTEVSRWKQSTFQAKELRLKDASWGYAFVWMPRPNGSYSLRKVVD